uniref:DUF4136 domain-containing protein n=1 Tax=Caenorhabditis tropicalis TaxID=1561998 RepID=A0A1I7UBN9_9PELO
MFILLSVLIVPILGCAPGTGTLGTRATFDYEIQPAVAYTYYTENNQLGQISKEYALRLVTSDVQNAINEVLQANSIPLNDVNKPTVTYTPPEVQIAVDATSCTAAIANQTIAFNCRITYLCKDKKPFNGQYSVPLSVQITAVTAIYESQWTVLANQVADKLTTKQNVGFVTDPLVTVS